MEYVTRYLKGAQVLRLPLLRWLWAIGLVSGIVWAPQEISSQVEQIPHWSGQGVAPVYEGYDTNPDGSYNMWFGYMNRNYEETLDVPVGPNNTFEPGGDRGQPTCFLTRRHKDVFGVVVPKDFGSKQLVWTITVRGKAERVVATLNPVWLIDRHKTTRGGTADSDASNTPPVVTAGPADQIIGLSDAASLQVSATDDGFPKRRGRGTDADAKPIGMTVAWSKYRGPGRVTFQPSTPAAPQAVVTGAVTKARFSEPGSYQLMVVVDDGSGETAGNFGYHCCWTNALVKVTVQGAASNGQR